MNNSKQKNLNRERRHRRIRARVSGTKETPRLSVFRSARYITAQLIDDIEGKTLAQATDLKVKKGTKIERATEVGKSIGALGKAKGINKVVFDRGGFLYAGRVKALAEAAREAGLQF